jgi:hypothetical protein
LVVEFETVTAPETEADPRAQVSEDGAEFELVCLVSSKAPLPQMNKVYPYWLPVAWREEIPAQ